jgi:hypothetical protein
LTGVFCAIIEKEVLKIIINQSEENSKPSLGFNSLIIMANNWEKPLRG